MATGAEVLIHLIPSGGWVISGDDYEGIQFIEAEPVSKEVFESAFLIVDEQKKIKTAEKVIAKTAVLERLGITAEEAELLLS